MSEANDATKAEQKTLDIPALNALVARLSAYLAGKGLSNATQAKKAEAIGLAHQSDVRKLLLKQHAATLEKVQIISDTTKIPVWRLLMPLEIEEAMRTFGIEFGDSKKEPQRGKESLSARPAHVERAQGGSV